MNYLLDTNIFITFTQKKVFRTYFKKTYNLPNDKLITSVVVEGELKSFTIQRKWGKLKQFTLYRFLDKCVIYPVKVQQIINRYAEIDAFSQGKHPTLKLPTSSRNMGKMICG